MAKYTQANRPMEVYTPLGRDVLLILGFRGTEAVSQLFHYQLEMVAENKTDIPFERLLGQRITVRLDTPGGQSRYFNGLCMRVRQGERDQEFTRYTMELVPELWTLTRRADIRTFQQITVPDILKQVLAGLDVTYEIQGEFQPRDYCVQYRETDFNFVSRLMEEEGIFYFFEHRMDRHTLVLANSPASHRDLPIRSQIIFEATEGGKRDEDRIKGWEKVQELRSGLFTLWDHSFEVPYRNLQAQLQLRDTAKLGQVVHQLRSGTSDRLEIYDYPGDYAGRFDGVAPGGQERPGEIQKIFNDNNRTDGIRMQQDLVQALTVHGFSNCRQFVSGHKFSLERHFNADGAYVLTSLQHDAKANVDYRTGDPEGFHYDNTFTALPFDVPFRPPRVTPKPTVEGTQTAVVVGPVGQEVFTDKYGRVKVQFKWDRLSRHNTDSSCWVRATQPWAGKRYGAFFLPRIGQEVIVDFLEGDPDQPIIVGMVYNADQMPPYLGKGLDPLHPHNPHISTIKTNSTPGGDGYNELRFDDSKGKEQIYIHAERNEDVRVKNDSMENIDHNKHMYVGAPAPTPPIEVPGYPGGPSISGLPAGEPISGMMGGEAVNEMDEMAEAPIVPPSNHQTSLPPAGSGGQSAGPPGNLFEKIMMDKHLQVLQDDISKVMRDVRHLTVGNKDVVTNQNKAELVGKQDSLVVGGDRRAQVGQADNLSVSSDRKTLVGANDHLTVSKNWNVLAGSSHNRTIGSNEVVKVGGGMHLRVGSDQTMQIGGKQSINVGNDQDIQVGKKQAVEAGQEVHIKAGTKVVIEAGSELTIKAGGGFINIHSGGVDIVGTMVNINSGGSPGDGSGVSTSMPQTPKKPKAPAAPQVARPAVPVDPAEAVKSVSGARSPHPQVEGHLRGV